MSNFFDNLYTKFLLRDILAKAVPGFLVLTFLFHGKLPLLYIKKGYPEIVVITVLYALSFVTGMFLQSLGAANFGKIIKKNWSIIKIYVHDDNPKQTIQEQSINKLWKFLDKSEKRDDLRTQRERFVILKNMSGTFFMAGLVILIITVTRKLTLPQDLWFLVGALLVLLGLNLHNRFHANEQKIWEDKIK